MGRQSRSRAKKPVELKPDEPQVVSGQTVFDLILGQGSPDEQARRLVEILQAPVLTITISYDMRPGRGTMDISWMGPDKTPLSLYRKMLAEALEQLMQRELQAKQLEPKPDADVPRQEPKPE